MIIRLCNTPNHMTSVKFLLYMHLQTSLTLSLSLNVTSLLILLVCLFFFNIHIFFLLKMNRTKEEKKNTSNFIESLLSNMGWRLFMVSLQWFVVLTMCCLVIAFTMFFRTDRAERRIKKNGALYAWFIWTNRTFRYAKLLACAFGYDSIQHILQRYIIYW